jgi:hypothetical protein
MSRKTVLHNVKREELRFYTDDMIERKQEMTRISERMSKLRKMKTEAQMCLGFYKRNNPSLAASIQRTLDWVNEELLSLHFEHAALREGLVPVL